MHSPSVAQTLVMYPPLRTIQLLWQHSRDKSRELPSTSPLQMSPWLMRQGRNCSSRHDLRWHQVSPLDRNKSSSSNCPPQDTSPWTWWPPMWVWCLVFCSAIFSKCAWSLHQNLICIFSTAFAWYMFIVVLTLFLPNLRLNVSYFDTIPWSVNRYILNWFYWIFLKLTNWKHVSPDLDISLKLRKWQTMAWNNSSPVHWRIYATKHQWVKRPYCKVLIRVHDLEPDHGIIINKRFKMFIP